MSSRNDRIALLIVDDHFLVRMGLIGTLSLEPDLAVVAEAANGPQAVDAYKAHRPHVSLVDLRLPGMSGIETIAAIRAVDPRAAIIAFSTYDADEEIYRALQAGARAYLSKSIQREDLLDAIRAVHAGRYHVPAQIAGRLAERMPRSELSLRELDVLRLVVNGRSNREIGDALAIAEATVKLHVSHILAKMGVRDRTEAATMALRRGIVQLEMET